MIRRKDGLDNFNPVKIVSRKKVHCTLFYFRFARLSYPGITEGEIIEYDDISTGATSG